ncbi:MAG: oligoribonuclease [Proteobacteria bacterium]|nr:MAG: oligoribonuclease [Pseudomonadota bacterium]
MPKAQDQLVWIDMEMSGLNPDTDVVLEIAILLTNGELEVTKEGPEIIVSQPKELFETMDNWNKEHHTKSGLWAAVEASKVSLKEAEDQIMAFLESNVAAKSSPICGNSIAQDRLFLRKYMPRVNDYLHYRMVDVSSVKELVKRWYPKAKSSPSKAGNHRAMDDIRESVNELKFYRENFFTKPS